jgi:hypothetical protein
MSCNNCNSNTPTYFTYSFPGCPTTPGSCSTNQVDAQNVLYTGPNLLNIVTYSNTDLQTILSNIDATIGALGGTNWADFNYYCLSDIETINSAQTFAETISQYVCDLSTDFSVFASTTYTSGITNLQNQIDAINNPGFISCTSLGIVNSDTLNQAITKVINALCTVDASIDPSSANWNQCYTVISAPTNITDAFNIVLDQICDLKSQVSTITVLPTFNNVGSCLAAPVTTTDSLYDTVVKIRDLACTSPTFDIDDVTYTSCITNPNPGGGADLYSVFNTILSYLNTTYQQRIVAFDTTQFTTSYYTPGDPCSGIYLELNPSLGITDKFVALNSGDTNPDYLLNKMTAGTNMSFDTITAPGTVIIDCTAEDKLVKADAGDASAGYLIDKVEGQSDITSSITITESYNSGTEKVDLTPSINYTNLATNLLDAIQSDPTLSAAFCAMVCDCQPCASNNPKQVMLRIVASGDPQDNTITLTQISPTATFYNANTVLDDVTFDTGWYTVTSPNTTLQGAFSLTNNNAAGTNYTVEVQDTLGATVPGSSSQSGTLGAGATISINPFIYGTGVTQFVVKVTLSS